MRGPRLLLALLVLGATFLVPTGAGGASATVVVDTVLDTFDGSCADDDCTLRDAIASVADGGTVRVPSGSYHLEIRGPGAVGAGDLDLTRPVTIVRAGAGGVFVDAGDLGDRAFEVAATEVVIRGLTVLGGRGAFRGGGVHVRSGTARLMEMTIAGGSTGRGGGGLSVGAGGHVLLSRSLVIDNRTRAGGGGVDVAGSAHVVDSAVVGNRGHAGGGIGIRSGTAVLENVTVAMNRSRTTGGGLRALAPVELTHVTVARNRALVGGGIAAPAGVVTSARTIVADNRAEADPTCTFPGASLGANVEGAAARCGFDRTSDLVRVDPTLKGLRANGGPTPTIALGEGSLAIDLGGRGCAPRDQRGVPRRSPCDAGAYERVLCLGRPVGIVGGPGDDELSGGREPDTFLGLGGDDGFEGSLAADRACGGAGDDLLIGGPGMDVLAGQRDDDRLEGGGGNDRLVGGHGDDRCQGGAGRDTARACEH